MKMGDTKIFFGQIWREVLDYNELFENIMTRRFINTTWRAVSERVYGVSVICDYPAREMELFLHEMGLSVSPGVLAYLKTTNNEWYALVEEDNTYDGEYHDGIVTIYYRKISESSEYVYATYGFKMANTNLNKLNGWKRVKVWKRPKCKEQIIIVDYRSYYLDKFKSPEKALDKNSAIE